MKTGTPARFEFSTTVRSAATPHLAQKRRPTPDKPQQAGRKPQGDAPGGLLESFPFRRIGQPRERRLTALVAGQNPLVSGRQAVEPGVKPHLVGAVRAEPLDRIVRDAEPV